MGSLLIQDVCQICASLITFAFVTHTGSATLYHTITYGGVNFPASRFNSLCMHNLFKPVGGMWTCVVPIALITSSYGMSSAQLASFAEFVTLPLQTIDSLMAVYVTQKMLGSFSCEDRVCTTRKMLCRVLVYIMAVNTENAFAPTKEVLEFQLWHLFMKVCAQRRCSLIHE